MDQLTPEQVAGRTFRQAFRGLDPSEVRAFLAEVAGLLGELTSQRDRLAGRLGEFAERDLKSEFAAVGIEITQVLEAAREAAEGMRDRASSDASRWRAEAMAETEGERKSAREDAEHLRSDAWVASEELIRQAQTEARRVSEAAERDSLSILGEAEREAHRLTASGRRESDEVTRTARMEAERLNAEAQARHDEIIEVARRQAEASQERARALEQRRQELLAELETLRSSLSRMEGELDQRRTRLDLSGAESPAQEVPAPTPSRAVTAAEQFDWGPGETVRVVSKRRQPAPAQPAASIEDVVDDVRRLRQGKAETKPLEPALSVPENVVEGTDAHVASATEEAEAPPTAPDDLADIFSRLRGAPPPPTAEASPAVAPKVPAPKKAAWAIDPFDVYQRLVLPVTNRALRNLKRQLTELQNQALEGARVSEGSWRPEVSDLETQLRPDLVVLLSESFAMGHNAAEELAGSTFPRPATPARDEAPPMATLLASQLSDVLSVPDEGGRERAAAISRVFRSWRTDEAERRVKDLASSAYHQGLERSLLGSRFSHQFEVGGRGCARCREAAEADEPPMPPIHPGCSCTLVPVSAPIA